MESLTSSMSFSKTCRGGVAVESVEEGCEAGSVNDPSVFVRNVSYHRHSQQNHFIAYNFGLLLRVAEGRELKRGCHK